MRILISAGEASGDLYASRLVEILRQRNPEVEFFGCAGPRMRAAGVEQIVDQESLAVAGIVEVIAHIPRIWREFKKLERAAAERKPDLAILTDSPDFHLRLAKKLRRLGIPVLYLIAPQVWAWREHRVRAMRRDLAGLLCIFPFEEPYFRKHGVPATYIGHPLARLVKPTLSRAELCAELGIAEDARILALLPGSRSGEIARHTGPVLEAVSLIQEKHPDLTPVFAVPKGAARTVRAALENFGKPNAAGHIQTLGAAKPEPGNTSAESARPPETKRAEVRIIEGHTWDVMAQAEVALAASGTVTMEAAMLRLPMVTFYRVNALSWYLGRWMVKAPFLAMVNLVAGRRVVAELIQHEMTPQMMAIEVLRLMDDAGSRAAMRQELDRVAGMLASEIDPMERAADAVTSALSGAPAATTEKTPAE